MSIVVNPTQGCAGSVDTRRTVEQAVQRAQTASKRDMVFLIFVRFFRVVAKTVLVRVQNPDQCKHLMQI
jgi:hypothetical protein